MKVKTSTLTDAALDWGVTLARKGTVDLSKTYTGSDGRKYLSTAGGFTINYADWAQAGPIIDLAGISFIKLRDKYGVDAKGYTTCERILVFGATVGEYFDADKLSNSYGDSVCEIYYIDKDLVATGPTQLNAAMRCYVANKLGDEIEVPDELLALSMATSDDDDHTSETPGASA